MAANLNDVDRLVDKLAKPIYVLRMARADTRKNSGAELRAKNARREIRNEVLNWVASQYVS